jgi:hypothetical protein
MMRRRRPLMRVAAGAAVGTVAYQAGKSGAQRRAVSGAPVESSGATEPAPAGQGGPTAELDRLAELHASGALTDAEFATAKSQVLGT